MSETGDIRIDKIMPKLKPEWQQGDFEKCLDKTGSVQKVKVNDLLKKGLFPVVDQGEKFVAGFLNEKELQYTGELPVILFGDHTRVIKFIDFPFIIGADGCKVLKPNKKFEINFFYHYLKSLNIVSQGYSRHYKFLKEIKVPIPDIEEQQQIVERLEARLGKLNSARQRLEKIPRILKRFRQSVLSSACSGKLTTSWREGKDLPEWEETLLRGICSKFQYGTSQKSDKEGLVPVLRMGNIQNGKIDYRDLVYTSDEVDIKKYALSKGKLP